MIDTKEAIETLKELNENYFSDDFDDANEAIILAIQALEKQINNGWIPVSERLPKETERILVTLKNECVCECFWINGAFKHVDSWKMREFEVNNPVIAWQPLPLPYKEVSK